MDATNQFLNFGPYVQNLAPGSYEAHYFLKIDLVRFNSQGQPTNNDLILRIDVAANLGASIRATRNLQRFDFASDGVYTKFVLPFTVQSPTESIEMRSFSFGNSYVEMDRIELKKVP